MNSPSQVPPAGASGAPMHGAQAPSDWVRRFSALVPTAATVLDVACGAGRHTRWYAARGCAVTAIDRDSAALSTLRGCGATLIEADIEADPWPVLADGAPLQFDAVVVTQYLWRPLLPTILASIKPGGLLLYETFAAGNEAIGKPSNPNFLLNPGELLHACQAQAMRIVAFEDGFVQMPKPAFIQRICALRLPAGPSAGSKPSVAYPLESQD
jgi:SAM-dependent methyltransferase